MKVLFLTYGNVELASSRIRIYQYLPYLKNRGIEYKVIPYHKYHFRGYARPNLFKKLYMKFLGIANGINITLKSIMFLLLSARSDIIVIQKVILPAWCQKVFFMLNKRTVVDIDDALWHNPKLYNMERFESLLRAADHAVLANMLNVEYVKQFNQNISVIVGPIDCQRYKPHKMDKEDCVIGWIGSPATEKYLKGARGLLNKISDKFNARLEFIGTSRDFDFGIVKKWSFESEIEDLGRFDIGIMPLSSDKWAIGKGGYKILQYMAMGIPTVASSVGINKELILDGVTGFLCDSDAEWADKLGLLISDVALRQKMGSAARERAVNYFSLERSEGIFINILKSVKK